jgi:hypothetical protein
VLQEACVDWRRALRILKQTYGGLANAPLNPLGNAIVACYALERCYDVVLEPTVTVLDRSFNLDVALKMDDKTLMLLEVKLHRKDVGLSETQVDEIYALGYHVVLLKRGIRVGAIHLYTSGKPPEPANRWTAVAYLPPQPQQVFTHVGDAINQLLEKLKVRR